MPRKLNRRRRPRRKVGRKGRGRRLAIPSAVMGGQQYAKVIETLQLPDINANEGFNQVFSLSMFERASSVSINFKEYRAKKVTWTYMPLYNTFQDQATAVGKPNIYIVMNRTQDLQWVSQSPTSELYTLQNCGARPMSFTANKSVSYVPNWCIPGVTTTGQNAEGAVITVYQSGLTPTTKWLASSPLYSPPGYAASTKLILDSNIQGFVPGQGVAQNFENNVVYNGHYLYIAQDNPTGSFPQIAQVVLTVEWEFRGAQRYVQPQATEPVVPATAPA